ncbi:hypothetical protein [Streptomyces californicus]|uniref:hypothetical protein n=1 Tax=Streptomyces californicus TaxID=67351 RepID=UPI0037BAB466
MYESHLTVLCEGDELRRLERWAARRPDVRFTHIALARRRFDGREAEFAGRLRAALAPTFAAPAG